MAVFGYPDGEYRLETIVRDQRYDQISSSSNSI